jgi:hypothetical protein
MARRNRNRRVRYLDEISSYAELTQARRDVQVKIRSAEQELAESAGEAFSLDNLLSIVAPPGSVLDSLIGSIDTGIATVRGIINGIALFRRKKRD